MTASLPGSTDLCAAGSSPKAKRVSAVVLSFNRCDETRTCLQSLLQQSYPEIDILILDNGSRDGSVEMLRQEFPQLRLLCMPKNYGDWEGRDIAARNCDGDYLFFVDNDAVMQPDTIAKLVERMEAEPQLAVVQTRVLDPDTGIPEGVGFRPEIGEIEHYRASFLGGAALIRTDIFRKAGGFPHYLLGGGEMFLSMRVLDMGFRVMHFPGTIIYHKRSKLERVLPRRYYLATKQRRRAIMAHYPGFFRPTLELFWKLLSYAWGATRNGYFYRLPVDLPRLFYWGLEARRGTWRISQETVRLIDYLHTHLVTSAAEFEAIPRHKSCFSDIIWRRLGNRAPKTTTLTNSPTTK
jgi:GT2 family glycosyltransferase